MRILNLHGLGGSSENTIFRMIRQASPSSEIVSETIDYVNTILILTVNIFFRLKMHLI